MTTDDIRMRGFRDRATVEAARAAAMRDLPPRRVEEVPVALAAGRVLAEDVASAVDVPPFDRSAMDGYAVRAADTFGVSSYEAVELRIVGESMPGAPTDVSVAPQEAARIMTGAPVPAGADAVVPAEHAIEDGDKVAVVESVTPGKNVGRRAEDVRAGEVVLAAGRRLRPQDVGLLASLGLGTACVVAAPRVRIVVTGNELLASGEEPAAARIFDSNTPMLRALALRDGGRVESAHRLRDDEAAISAALAAPGADVILAAGGTSVGREDHLPGIVRALGRLDVHGVAMRPSSPTGIGTIGAARVFLLPGNPVSCLAAYDFFAGPAIRSLAARPDAWPYPVRRVRLAVPLPSHVGRVDYCRVTIGPRGAEPLAVGGASALSSTTRAAGFVVVPAASEGFPEGAEVEVHLYDLPLAGEDVR